MKVLKSKAVCDDKPHVVCDKTNNTKESMERGELHINICYPVKYFEFTIEIEKNDKPKV